MSIESSQIQEMEITAIHSLKLQNPLNYSDLQPSSICFSAVTVLPHSTRNVLSFNFLQRKLYDAGRLKSIRAINASSNSADGVQKPLLEPIEKSNSFPKKELEQTFIMIKPDGVQRGLVGEIISRFEKKGFTLKGLKFLTVERPFAEKHYTDLSAKPFFKKLVDYIISGPVVAMVWEGKNVVTTGRKIIGTTNPSDSAPGTIRGDFGIDTGRNVIHGSDAVESATKEIALWFPEGVTDWRSSLHSWIYE